MKIADIIALKKQGFTLAEIKELPTLADDIGQDVSTEEEKDSAQDRPAPDEEEKVEVAEEPLKVEDAVDYKILYEETKKKLEDLQKENVRKDNSGKNEEDRDKILEDIVRNFM